MTKWTCRAVSDASSVTSELYYLLVDVHNMRFFFFIRNNGINNYSFTVEADKLCRLLLIMHSRAEYFVS